MITPELLRGHAVYLAGFGHNRVATGVHDDLYARCLALGITTQTLVICSADLIGLFYDDVLTIRRAFQQNTSSASFLIVASTHTHAGPDMLGLYGPEPRQTGIDGKYLEWVDQRIASTAADAVRERDAVARVSKEPGCLGIEVYRSVRDARLFFLHSRSSSNEIGCDYHPGFQQIASVDSDTGEFREGGLQHRGEAEKFYRELGSTAGLLALIGLALLVSYGVL